MSDFEFLRAMPFPEFVPRDVWMQRIDPRAFLICFFLLFSAALFATSISGLLAILLFSIFAVLLSRVPLKVHLRGYFSAIPFILILVVINLFFNTKIDNTQIYFQWKFIVLSSVDIQYAVLLFIRFSAAIFLISLTSSTLSTSRFIHGLESLLSPLKALKIPVRDFIVAVEIAIRFIPILTLTAERIAKAQASRGAMWGSSRGNLIARIRQTAPILVPLFIQSLHKAETLALAMDARGFGVSPTHSSYTRSHISTGDILVMILCLVFTLGVFQY